MCLQSDIFTCKTYQAMGKVLPFQFQLYTLFSCKEQQAARGPLPCDAAISIPSCRPASPVSLLCTVSPGSHTDLYQLLANLAVLPASLVFPLETVLFNYLAGNGSGFSLFSWQLTRTHPSFGFSQRRSTSSHSRGPVKSCSLSIFDKGEEAGSSLQEQPHTEVGHQ